MRVTLGTPIEKLSDKQKMTWVPKMFKKGLRFVDNSFIQPDDLDWRPTEAGILVYVQPQALAGRLSGYLPDPSLAVWALRYMQYDDSPLRVSAGISGEQPLEEVAYVVSILTININTRCLAATNCANRLTGLWRAGLIQFTIPVKGFPDKNEHYRS